MASETGNNDPRVIEAIKNAIDLDSKGQTNLAIRQLISLVDEFPSAASIHGHLSLFSYRMGYMEKSIEHGRYATSLSPKPEKASLVLFRALWKTGQRVEALSEMRRFLSLEHSEEYSKIIRDWELTSHEVDASKC